MINGEWWNDECGVKQFPWILIFKNSGNPWAGGSFSTKGNCTNFEPKNTGCPSDWSSPICNCCTAISFDSEILCALCRQPSAVNRTKPILRRKIFLHFVKKATLALLRCRFEIGRNPQFFQHLSLFVRKFFRRPDVDLDQLVAFFVALYGRQALAFQIGRAHV